MKAVATRPLMCLAAAVGAQAAGVGVLAALQYLAFVADCDSGARCVWSACRRKYKGTLDETGNEHEGRSRQQQRDGERDRSACPWIATHGNGCNRRLHG